MKEKFERKPDGTIELRITLLAKDIKNEWETVVSEMVKSADLPGFRKGKAPKKLVEEKLDKTKIKDEVLKKLLPEAYAEAIKANNLKPIVDPQIHIDEELIDGKDWNFHILTCEAPVVNLGTYKAEVKKITAKSKIIIPGKTQETVKIDEIIDVVLKNVDVKIPIILIQKEADRLLSQMLDEIKKLGMSLDQYLSSTQKTAENIRAEYANKAERDLKLEFVLQKIAVAEKITVEEVEIQKTIDSAKPEEKEGLIANKYLLASIIRQQKTLDFLKNL